MEVWVVVLDTGTYIAYQHYHSQMANKFRCHLQLAPLSAPQATNTNLLPGNLGMSIPTLPTTVPLNTTVTNAAGLTSASTTLPNLGDPSIAPLVNLAMPPVISTNMPPLNIPPVSGIAPLPDFSNLNLPPLNLPPGVSLPSLDSLKMN